MPRAASAADADTIATSPQANAGNQQNPGPSERPSVTRTSGDSSPFGSPPMSNSLPKRVTNGPARRRRSRTVLPCRCAQGRRRGRSASVPAGGKKDGYVYPEIKCTPDLVELRVGLTPDPDTLVAMVLRVHASTVWFKAVSFCTAVLRYRRLSSFTYFITSVCLWRAYAPNLQPAQPRIHRVCPVGLVCAVMYQLPYPCHT